MPQPSPQLTPSSPTTLCPAGTYVLYITSGTVDVLAHYNTATPASPAGTPKKGAASPVGGGGATPSSATLEDDEVMNPIVDEESRIYRLNLLRAATKVMGPVHL